ncbi:MAG: 2-C-methyl-D-erythritol 4-phosphate cytidylyltransferase [Clostridiales bacterium]|nr:2-C-methyl-D-erythritol 4-phosphate cytidylyltransferase [Clostridiales bacterium]
MKEKSVAIVLAAGSGSRMKSDTPKQYMDLAGKPVIYYSLHAFEVSSIDEVILVVGENEVDYNRDHIVEKYNFTKVRKIVVGGSERYFSVYNGLKAIDYADYVLIHDGARPFITREILDKVLCNVKEYDACVVGMPSKDTIKIADEKNKVVSTPDRNYTWIIQTPQAFSYSLIMKAYNKIIGMINAGEGQAINITDDAMVVEYTSDHPIKLVKGSYFNIKITTPEDIRIGNVFLESNRPDME